MTYILDDQMMWRQFAVAIDDLGRAMRNCPELLWEARLWADEPGQWVAAGFSSYWYLCYHTLFWLDLYLTGAEEGFAPPPPFDLVEMEEGEVLPRVYSRRELLDYWTYCRQRSRETIEGLTVEQANRMCQFAWGEVPFGELLIYTMRHVQEHSAQLLLFLGQQSGESNT
jgi:hypothetical protein